MPHYVVRGDRRPVEILEDEEDRARLCEPRQLLDEHVLHLPLRPPWVDACDGALGVVEDPSADVRTERLEKGLVGRLGTVCARAEQDAPARPVDPASQLRDKPCLADSRLAGDDRHKGAPAAGLLPSLCKGE